MVERREAIVIIDAEARKRLVEIYENLLRENHAIRVLRREIAK